MSLLPLIASVLTDAPDSGGSMLSPYMGVFFVAFVLSFFATPIMRWLAVRNGILDLPDLQRKNHIEPIAYLGGVAIFLGWLGGVLMSWLIEPPFADGRELAAGGVPFPLTIIIGATIIVITGLCDDVLGISPRRKVGGQILAAAALVFDSNLGPRLISDVFIAIGFDLPPSLQWVPFILGPLFVAVLVIGGCNSLNLLDGLDGLAAGVSAISTLGFLFMAAVVASEMLDPSFAMEVDTADMLASPIRIVMCLAILGAVLGFLPYNFNPATIFMGDAGSLLLGFLGASTILLFASVPNRGPVLVMAALIVFALPITDTTLAIVRRKMRGKPILSPDNQHLHHLVLNMTRSLGMGQNIPVKAAVILMYALSVLFAAVGCALMFSRWRYVMAVFLVLFGFIIITAYKAGHRGQVLARAKQDAKQTSAPLATDPDETPV